MNRFILACCLSLVSNPLLATDRWHFAERIAVTDAAAEGVFHHLEGAGRKHIAVSGQAVASAWEDNRSGAPQVYAAIRPAPGQPFAADIQISFADEAYEPAIGALSGNRFVVTWEQDGRVYARSLAAGIAGKPLALSTLPSGHASIAAWGKDIYCVWREQQQPLWNLVLARLRIDAFGNLVLLDKTNLLHEGTTTAPLFPSISANPAGINLAWEDRQAGHTRLKHSFSTDRLQTFSTPAYLNEFHANRNQYDKGSGVTRVTLAAFAQDEVIAAWMDKRRGIAGYGIYAALGSEDSFGPNEKVHGPHGDLLPHYNPASSGNAQGDFVVAWDDYRDGDSDIWLSAYDDAGEWSRDFAPPPAAGKGEQSHASVALDARGDLHIVWIERGHVDAPTRLWYSHGESEQP